MWSQRARRRSVGIRDLKAHASELVERVQATGEPVQITRRGKPVAMLSAASDALATPDADALQRDLGVWAQMDQLADEIGKRWPAGVSAVDTLSRSRR